MTEAELKHVDEVVARTGGRPEAVIPILQSLQEHYGYLPEPALQKVCKLTNITPAAIAGVSTFYDMFRHKPTGKHVVRVCRGTACHVAGAERVEDSLRRHLHIPEGGETDAEGQFTVETVACLGCCTLAPVIKVDERTMGFSSAEVAPNQVREYLEESTNTSATCTEEIVETPHEHGTEILVGLGSCCMAKGSDRLFAELRADAERHGGKVNVKRVGCVGMCHRTPLVEVVKHGKDGDFYSGVSVTEARALLQKADGPTGLAGAVSRLWTRVVDNVLLEDAPRQTEVDRFSMGRKETSVRAFLDSQKHIATEHFGRLDPLDLDEYLAHDGFVALRRCLGINPDGTPMAAKTESKVSTPAAKQPEAKPDRTGPITPQELITTMENSGLRGRGGAGFPTGRKWRVGASQPGDVKYVVCNGDEGDPGAFMDRMILESFPFRVIEGLATAAVAINSHEGIFYIRHEYPLAVKRVRAAIAEMEKRGWLGDRLMGSDYALRLSVVEGAGAFVCGEETALIASVEGKRGMPHLRPPFPVESGLWDKPTMVNNVETLALVPWIVRNGAEAFSSIGTAKSKGTKVFALTGNIRRGGLIEVPMGTTIRQIVEDIGGGVGEGRKFKAVQIGGPSGGCVPARLADTPVDYDALAGVNAIMGSGGLVVLDDTACMVDIARYFLRFTQDQSCGKCTFCRIGTRRMLDILDKICTGKAQKNVLEDLESLARKVGAGSLCGLGKTAPNPVLSTLKYFREEYEAHLQGRCPAGRCTALISYNITADCTGCTICAQSCPVKAIPFAPYARHEIIQDLCTRCDTCRRVCPHHAIEVK